MNQSQIDYEKTLSIWWSMTWRVLIFRHYFWFYFWFYWWFRCCLGGLS